jgi:hypothetical protein
MGRDGPFRNPEEIGRPLRVEAEHHSKCHDLSLTFGKGEQAPQQLGIDRGIIGDGYFWDVV